MHKTKLRLFLEEHHPRLAAAMPLWIPLSNYSIKDVETLECNYLLDYYAKKGISATLSRNIDSGAFVGMIRLVKDSEIDKRCDPKCRRFMMVEENDAISEKLYKDDRYFWMATLIDRCTRIYHAIYKLASTDPLNAIDDGKKQ